MPITQTDIKLKDALEIILEVEINDCLKISKTVIFKYIKKKH